MAHRVRPAALAAALLLLASAARADFVNFESGHVRPLALSPDGSRLYAANTPDNRLEIFAVNAAGLRHVGAVPVGLEPVAVAVRNAGEVWVVNHLSDSVSVVDVAADPPRVVRTLLTCDEPRDIVFAGPGGARAFVTTARRGQNCPVAADSTTAGIGRAIVQVWDATTLPADASLGGTPLTNVVLFGDTPRALTRSADGNTVFAAVFHSGNQSTTLSEGTVCDGGAAASACGAFLPGGLPAPNVDANGVPGPETGLIVRVNPATGLWEDPLARDWSGAVRFTLPDLDVFTIDASGPVPTAGASFAHVGTILFDMATNPVNGRVYVTNTEARNEVRFEGPRVPGDPTTTVQGHIHEARITVLDGASVLPRHLNKHIDYDVRPAPPGTKEHSLATPVGMAVSSDGQTLYVAAFGSSRIGVFSTAALEADTFVPDAATHVPVSGGGPTGLVLDEPRGRLYTFTRFDSGISVVDTATLRELAHVTVPSPEPTTVTAGRRFLYDADHTSSNGEASCSSCHVFGDLDSLAWDLGNPTDVVLNNPLPFRIPPLGDTFEDFHPLKGPMTTQSLRGMANHGSMHWRGDRTAGNDPGGDVDDEDGAFKKFNGAFPGLIGRESELPADEMQAFTDFILGVTYPPNPIRRLNNTFTNRQQQGHDLYFGRITDALFNCNGCHTLDPVAGFFGSDGAGTFEGEPQMFKVAHLRNAYQKVGMFRGASANPPAPQIRGFGFLHDGSVDTVFRFLSAGVFSLTNTEQRQLEDFVLAFDSNLAPIVGQQVTLHAGNATTAGPRIDLLLQRDTTADECQVVVKGTLGGETRGGWLTAGGTFQLDRAADAPLTDAALRALATAPGQELTYTCVPKGSGERIGVDRDGDGALDADERDAGTDPSDPTDRPGLVDRIAVATTKLVVADDGFLGGTGRGDKLTFRSAKRAGVASGVVVPPWGGTGDPTLGGARFTVYGGAAGPVTVTLPASGWKRTGSAAKPGYRYADSRGTYGPVTSVKLVAGTLTVRAKGAGLYPLVAAPQSTLALRLRLGTTTELCASAPAKAPAGLYDTRYKFVGTVGSPAPSPCPPVS